MFKKRLKKTMKIIWEDPFLNIVLVEPEIPNNTGNIGRTCLAGHSCLHLVEPFGFELSDRTLKRAGLDYWQHLDVRTYRNLADLLEQIPDTANKYFLTTKTKKSYTDVQLKKGDWLFFGPETRGLDSQLLSDNDSQCITVPMPGEKIRSLNLANTVAILLFEGLRQLS